MTLGVSSISSSMNFDPVAMIKKLDSYSDGSISKEEFLANIKKQDGDTDEKLLKMIEETDSDGDGKISQAEDEAVMKKMQQGGKPKGPPQAQSANASSKSSSSSSTTYDVRDTDKDGEVTIQEKLAYILKQLEENAKTESTQSEYVSTGQTNESSSLVATTFSIKA